MFRLKDLTCLLLNGEWFRCIVLKLLKILIALALTEVTTGGAGGVFAVVFAKVFTTEVASKQQEIHLPFFHPFQFDTLAIRKRHWL